MIALIFSLSLIIISFILYIIIESINQFEYPTCIIEFDVTGVKNPNILNYIDDYINKNGFNMINTHYNKVLEWKQKCEYEISHSLFSKYKRKQYNKSLHDDKMFYFKFVKFQKCYKQKKGVKYSYKLKSKIKNYYCDYETLNNRFSQLSKINFECTLLEWEEKNQRKLMTKKIREQIALRDNYTCQICGKHMPDGVGLQIDHIIPISKGGKSVPSNLQVLCSKCNGKKSDKIS